MFIEWVPSLRLTAATFVLCGLVYPLAMTGAAEALFPHQARGSVMLGPGGRPVGSALVGQKFEGARWFSGRVSSIDYKAEASGASNLGPTSKALLERVGRDVARARRENPTAAGPVPADWLTQSGSGLDPHLSPAAARYQAARVALARRLPESEVLSLITAHTRGPDWGLFGEPRVNVLALNMALEALPRR